MKPVSISIFKLFTDNFSLLTSREKLSAGIMSLFLLLVSVLDMVAMVGVMPLISVIVEPELLETNKYLAYIYGLFDGLSHEQFIIFLAIGAALLMLISMTSSIYIQNKARLFVIACQNRLAGNIFQKIVNAPYSWFLNRSASESSHHISNDILMWANDGLLRTLLIVGNASLLLVSIVLMVVVSPLEGVLAVGIIGFVGFLIIQLSKKPIDKLSDERRKTSANTLVAANQIFTGIKDIKISSREEYFIKSYLGSFSRYGYSGALLRLIQNIPPMTMNFLAQISLIVIVLVLWDDNRSSGEIAAQMALIVLVVSRIVPAANRLISELTGMRAVVPHVQALLEHHEKYAPIENQDASKKTHPEKRETHWQKIILSDVSYRYEGANNRVLDSISAELLSGKSYGVAGPSGAGKSTLVDLVLGLISAETGSVKVDDVELGDGSRLWWFHQIGYVPQSPFIADASLRKNIAFGIADEAVDDQRVMECMKLASLDDLIETLDDGLDSHLGDRGLKISGGQRQRVAIARALYDRPNLLVLDEATSALDTKSETKVHQAIAALYGKITTIIIAHRISTIKNCDSILLIENGKLVANENYSELIKHNRLFKQLACGQNSDA